MKLEKVIDVKLCRTFEWDRFLKEARANLPTVNISFERRSSILKVSSSDADNFEAFGKALEFKLSGKQYTHFYSLPVPLENKLFEEFKGSARRAINEPSLDLMFMPHVRLHLTVCMLSFQSAEIAISILENLQFKPFNLQFDSLGEDVTKVKVIYAEPRPCDELDCISVYLNKTTRDAGLTDALFTLWHCTLLNTRYARKGFCTIDASQFFRKHKDFSFGQVVVESIHLSCLQGNSSVQFYKSLYRLEN